MNRVKARLTGFIKQLHGDAEKRAREVGVESVQLSISHSETHAIAIAMASRRSGAGFVGS